MQAVYNILCMAQEKGTGPESKSLGKRKNLGRKRMWLKLAFCPVGPAFTVVKLLMAFYIDEITFGIDFVLKLSSRCLICKPVLKGF